jgi:hypothetical protein
MGPLITTLKCIIAYLMAFVLPNIPLSSRTQSLHRMMKGRLDIIHSRIFRNNGSNPSEVDAEYIRG